MIVTIDQSQGTVHIFALQDYKLNKRSALASIGVPGAYAGEFLGL